MHYYAIKGLLDGDIESSIVFNLKEISLHREGPNATIYYDTACQSFGSVCWTLEAIILQHTSIERMYSSITEVIWTTPSWKRMTIRVAVIAVHVGFYQPGVESNFYHNVHSSRIDCRRFSRRNLRWGQPFTLPWTLHRGEVLNAGKTTSSENSSVEVQSKLSVKEIPA